MSINCEEEMSLTQLRVNLVELRELRLYGVTDSFKEPFGKLEYMLKYSLQASKLEFLRIDEYEIDVELDESASSVFDKNFDNWFAGLLSALQECTRLRCLEFALVTELSVKTLNELLLLVVRKSSLHELRLRLDGNPHRDDLYQILMEKGKWWMWFSGSHSPVSIFHRQRIPASPPIWTHKAVVKTFAVNKYLGDYKYVVPRLPETKEESCLGIQNKYHVQIIALENINGFIEWFPNVASCFQRNDVVYYVPVGDVRGDGFTLFQDEVVRKDTHTVVKMNAVEFTPKLNGWPTGAPEHLHNFVIGAKEHRGSNDQLGALYLRNTFAGLAIHLIIKPNGEIVKFPGPKQILEKGDRFFMLGGICNDPLRRTGPLLKSEDVAKMMEREKFYDHIQHMTGPLVWPSEIRVRLPDAVQSA